MNASFQYLQKFSRENYRGFCVQSCLGKGIEREDEKGNPEVCEGYYCQVYPVLEGTDSPPQIDEFSLAVGHEISDLSDTSLDVGIRKYIDGNYRTLLCRELENIKPDTKAPLSEMIQSAATRALENQPSAEATTKVPEYTHGNS